MPSDFTLCEKCGFRQGQLGWCPSCGYKPEEEPPTAIIPTRGQTTNLDWAKAVLATELPSRAKLVACAMAFVAPRKTMEAWPGMAYLGDKTSLHRDTVREALRDLVDAGWLIRLSHGSNTHGNRAAVYRLSFRPLKEGWVAESALVVGSDRP